MPRLEWRPAAIADLISIIDYIADHNPNAAQALKDDVEIRAIRLLDNPLSGRAGRVNGTREIVVRPNYLLIYTADEYAVVILRVLHAARQWP